MSTDWRLTPRGRRVLSGMVLLAVVGVAAAGVTLVRNGGAPAVSSTRTTTVTVEPGQSLWQIAREVAPAADARATVDRIAELNGLPNPQLAPGQTLVVPSS